MPAVFIRSRAVEGHPVPELILLQCMARKSHTRRSSNKIIAGVLAGIAKAIGLDPGLVRLMYLFGAFFSAIVPAVIIYLILWAWMPPPESGDAAD